MTEAPLRRQTRQRTAVAEALDSQEQFRSAQEIHDVVRHRGDSVGLTTVYRALQAMAEDGQVDVIVRDDGEAVYRQCSPSHHHHLVCRSCHTTIEVETWATRISAEHGFRDVTHTIEVFGLCTKC